MKNVIKAAAIVAALSVSGVASAELGNRQLNDDLPIAGC